MGPRLLCCVLDLAWVPGSAAALLAALPSAGQVSVARGGLAGRGATVRGALAWLLVLIVEAAFDLVVRVAASSSDTPSAAWLFEGWWE